MDYEKLTIEQIVSMRQDIQLQQDALDELDDRLIKEIGTRAGKDINEKLEKLFNL